MFALLSAQKSQADYFSARFILLSVELFSNVVQKIKYDVCFVTDRGTWGKMTNGAR